MVIMKDNCLKDAGVICIFAASEEHLLCDIVNETCTMYVYKKCYLERLVLFEIPWYVK